MSGAITTNSLPTGVIWSTARSLSPHVTSVRSRRQAIFWAWTRQYWRTHGSRSGSLARRFHVPGSSKRSMTRCGPWLTRTNISPIRPRGSSANPTRTGCGRSCTLRCNWSMTPRRLLTPFLPYSADKVYKMLGGEGAWSGMPEIREVDEPDGAGGASSYPVLIGRLPNGCAVGVEPGTCGHAAGPAGAVVRQARPVRRRARGRTAGGGMTARPGAGAPGPPRPGHLGGVGRPGQCRSHASR